MLRLRVGLNGPVPRILGRRAGNDLTNSSRNNCRDLATKLGRHRDDIFHVLDGLPSLLWIAGDQITSSVLNCNRAPTFDVVFFS
jgi:hypothetical protein